VNTKPIPFIEDMIEDLIENDYMLDESMIAILDELDEELGGIWQRVRDKQAEYIRDGIDAAMLP